MTALISIPKSPGTPKAPRGKTGPYLSCHRIQLITTCECANSRLQEAANPFLEHGRTTGTDKRELLFLRLFIIEENPDLPEQELHASAGNSSTRATVTCPTVKDLNFQPSALALSF